MATCKDCVHAEVCRFKDLPAPLSDSYIRESECIEKRCGDFKDRSRFVELPCKLGDFVYFIKARRVMADIVSKFTIDRCGVMLQRVNGYNLGYTDQLGKKIFLTHEEAEKAFKDKIKAKYLKELSELSLDDLVKKVYGISLKERENNDKTDD